MSKPKDMIQQRKRRGTEQPRADIQLSPARKNPVLRRLADAIGRETLMQALELADDQRLRTLADMLADPAYSRCTFAKLCEKASVRMTEVVDAFRRYKLDEGVVAMYQHLPEVMEDTAQDAKSRSETCGRCKGEGKIAQDDSSATDCPQCAGTGIMRVPGDADSRKLVFETAGLVGRRGLMLAQQFNIGDGGFSVESLITQGEKLIGGA